MTSQVTMQDENTMAQAKPSDKELNFRRLEEKHSREIAQERAAREEMERQLAELRQAKEAHDDDDVDAEPYIDKKRLKKEQAKFGQQLRNETQNEIKSAVSQALAAERQQNWLKQNGDFYDVMKHANTFAQHDPELAETILEMPDTFERQKLVYKNIKALGLHKPPEQKKDTSLQDKINANQRTPYYQPSGIGTAPYTGAGGDFSATGQESAYKKMQELKRRLGG